ncbi:MAG TPA: DUF4184 family protein [Steroidobacteraceae bacterium]|nr:DUF4184 family protein [Steroidobacteraceae bacterium]
MPFTLAHPAAILPLRGLKYLRTTPLIIGAMTPDLPYYVPARFAHFGPETHSLTGAFTTCLVLGYAALGCVYLLRRPLTALLSARARWLYLTALAPFSGRPLEWALAAVSIILGVWTHLLWDSFTHNDGWIVRRVAFLSAPVSFGWYSGTVCHVLQYLSSGVGLAAMALWYCRLPVPAAAPVGPGAPRSSVGPVLMLVAVAAILIGGVQATQAFSHTPVIYRTLDIFLTRSLAWFAVLYLVAGTVVTLEHGHDGASGTHR